MRTAVFSLLFVWASASAFGDTFDFTNITVSGSTIIESADGNMTSGQISGAGGTAAVLALSFNPAVAGETITINSGGITGEDGCCGSVDAFADGGTDSTINISSIGGISGMTGPYSTPLTGVFINGNTALPGSAPATLSYGTADLQDASYSPLLDQVFFIGDGYTGNDLGGNTQTGTQQVFDVPVGATELFLGIEDACNFNGTPTGCYGDNPGSFTVSGQLNVPVSGTPEPASVFLLGSGLVACLGMARRRKASLRR